MKKFCILFAVAAFLADFSRAEAATYMYNLTIQTGYGVSGGDLYAGTTKVISGCSSTCSGTGTKAETALVLKYNVPDPWTYGKTMPKELTISSNMDSNKKTKNSNCMIGMQVGWPVWLWLKSFTEN